MLTAVSGSTTLRRPLRRSCSRSPRCAEHSRLVLRCAIGLAPRIRTIGVVVSHEPDHQSRGETSAHGHNCGGLFGCGDEKGTGVVREDIKDGAFDERAADRLLHMHEVVQAWFLSPRVAAGGSDLRQWLAGRARQWRDQPHRARDSHAGSAGRGRATQANEFSVACSGDGDHWITVGLDKDLNTPCPSRRATPSIFCRRGQG